jgi:hypothetical protein
MKTRMGMRAAARITGPQGRRSDQISEEISEEISKRISEMICERISKIIWIKASAE